MKAYTISFKPNPWPDPKDFPLPPQRETAELTEAARLLYQMAIAGLIVPMPKTIGGYFVWAKVLEKSGRLQIECLGEQEKNDHVASIARDGGADIRIVEQSRAGARRLMKTRGIKC